MMNPVVDTIEIKWCVIKSPNPIKCHLLHDMVRW